MPRIVPSNRRLRFDGPPVFPYSTANSRKISQALRRPRIVPCVYGLFIARQRGRRCQRKTDKIAFWENAVSYRVSLGEFPKNNLSCCVLEYTNFTPPSPASRPVSIALSNPIGRKSALIPLPYVLIGTFGEYIFALIVIVGQSMSESNTLWINPRTFSVLSTFNGMLNVFGHFFLIADNSVLASVRANLNPPWLPAS